MLQVAKTPQCQCEDSKFAEAAPCGLSCAQRARIAANSSLTPKRLASSKSRSGKFVGEFVGEEIE